MLSLGVLTCPVTNASFAIHLRIYIYFRTVLILSTLFSLSCNEEQIPGDYYYRSFKQYSLRRTRRLRHEHKY
jgi:hypothetical protein